MTESSAAFLQFLSSINKQIVKGLAAADLKLEDVGLLPKIEQEELPDDITDEDGNLLNDCAEVSWASAFPNAPLFLTHTRLLCALKLGHNIQAG